MPRPSLIVLFLLALVTRPGMSQTSTRYVIYLHGRIVETEQDRRPTDDTFGTFEYDAILDSLRRPGFVVLSEQRPPRTDSDSFANHVAEQVDSLVQSGVSPDAITVMGFSKGGWIAILASARLRNPAVSFVIMAACGPWAFDRQDLYVSGRLLSLYETSDSLGVSCAPLFARRSPRSQTREIALSLGLGHGTFFQPRPAWLSPAITWAQGHEP
ncbi:MAG TPA: alpha/beta hydrolase [Gemmatimonadales bacterium]|nr:alpha/beta hydrolase [Gemmatimonadales bacterium]